MFFFACAHGKDQSLDFVGKSPTSIYSEHAIMLSLNSGKILYSKTSEEKTYPASLTKIMTTLLAIESLPNLTETVLLTDAEFAGLYEQHAVLAGFKPNENVRVIDLLYGTMLPSGAEAAAALATTVSGSQEEFLKRMNAKAKELGMKGTHFANVEGLHDRDHYTTVKDMATLLQYALKNDQFRNVFTTVRYSTIPTNLNSEGISFYNSMFQRMEIPAFDGGRIIGGKTGFTDEAGLCLASLAVNGDKEYLIVTTNANGDQTTRPYHILDALALYNRFAN